MTHFLYVLCLAAYIGCALTKPVGSYQSPWYRNNWRSNDWRSNDWRSNNWHDDAHYLNAVRRNQQRTADADARIMRMHSVPHEAGGSYAYAYETENGIKVQERGIPYDLGPKGLKEAVEGSYSYVSPEGLHVFVRYTADETGFHPYISYGANANILSRNAMPAHVTIRKNAK